MTQEVNQAEKRKEEAAEGEEEEEEVEEYVRLHNQQPKATTSLLCQTSTAQWKKGSCRASCPACLCAARTTPPSVCKKKRKKKKICALEKRPNSADSSAGHAHFAHTRAPHRCTGYAFTVSEHFTHGSEVSALASRLLSHFHMFPVGGRGAHSAPGCSIECVCL